MSLYKKAEKAASDFQNTQFFKDTINSYAKTLENELDNFVVEETRTGNTIAGFNQIPTPEDYLRLKFLYVLNGTIRYDATPVYSEDRWQQIVAFQQTVSTNYLTNVFPRIDYMELFPIPSSILPYTLQYVSESKDMQYDDYTTGTITSITNTTPLLALPYATVVGNGTTWTPNMVGRFFQMSGDKQWYKITGWTSTTQMTLGKAYAGIAISGFPDLTYTIAEMPRLPEAIHMVLYYAAMAEYYEGIKKDATKGIYFRSLYDKWAAWGKATFSSRVEMGVIPSQRRLRGARLRNPNLFPISISSGS
jgi:hypothetical protein